MDFSHGRKTLGWVVKLPLAISGGWKYNTILPPPPPPSGRPFVHAATRASGETHHAERSLFCSGGVRGGGRKPGERRVRLSVVALGCPAPESHRRQQQREQREVSAASCDSINVGFVSERKNASVLFYAVLSLVFYVKGFSVY